MKAVMYHYVQPWSPWLPRLHHMTVDRFQRQLDWLQKERDFVSREDFHGWLNGGPLPDGALLTFDDGLACHVEHVVPVLQQRGLWGMFFVNDLVGEDERAHVVHQVHEYLAAHDAPATAYLLRARVENGMLVDAAQAHYAKTYDYLDDDESERWVKRLFNYWLKPEWVPVLLEALGADDVGGEWYGEPNVFRFHVGWHGRHHLCMSKFPEDVQRDELQRPLGVNIHRTYAHPYGGPHSYNDTTLRLLEQLEYRCAFDVDARDITSDDHPYRLPRWDCCLLPHGRPE